MRNWIMSGLLVLASAGVAAAQPALVELKVVPKKSVFKGSSWKTPLVLKSAEEAGKHFDEKALAVLKEKVDFGKQIVLVFAWMGSGQDKLSYVIQESFPEQIPFSLQPGRTRDLRQHVRVFVLRSNVRWSIAGKR